MPGMETNRLYYGDNLTVLRDQIPSETVDLCYIDPPFNSARNYFVIFKDRTGEASQAQSAAFEDTWTWSIDSEYAFKELTAHQPNHELQVCIAALRTMLKESPMMAYLVSMAQRFVEIHRVLKPTGSFYLHCDATASHYLKIVLDTVFGPDNFRNEIVWKRTTAKSLSTKKLPVNHDVLLVYQKSDVATWNSDVMFLPYDESHLDEKTDSKYSARDTDGRRFQLTDLTNPNKDRPNLTYEFLGVTRVWRWTRERMQTAYEAGLVIQPSPGSVPRLKRYLDEQRGKPIDDVWVDLPPINSQSTERLGYPTQKPLALLRRIIEASSNPGDVVLDCYCGCGTTVHAAHELGRRWVGIDITPVAVAVIKTRLEQTFDGLKVPVIGFPTDYEGAKSLFEADPYQFQTWACTTVGAYPRMKKGADKGIDGDLPFYDYNEKHQRMVVQVKGGKVSVNQIRDLRGTIEREKAAIGLFVCLEEPTKPMLQEAAQAGLWSGGGGKDYPRIQILPVQAILEGSAYPQMPMQEKKSLLGFKASKGQQKGQQKAAKLTQVNGQAELVLE